MVGRKANISAVETWLRYKKQAGKPSGSFSILAPSVYWDWLPLTSTVTPVAERP
jgi:hypothetical protein